MEEKELDNVGADAQVDKPVGRAAILEKWRANNPNAEGEPTEEELWEIAREGYDGLKGNHKDLIGANTKLAEAAKNDPRFGAFLGMVAGEDPQPANYSLGKIYGKDAFNDDEDYLRGVQEYNESQANSEQEREEANNNFKESLERLKQFISDNKLDEKQADLLIEGIMALADSFLMGTISTEIMDLINKGINYDVDVEDAAITGEVEGRNKTIEAKMKEKTEAPSGVVDLGNGTGAGRNKPLPKKKKGSFYDALEE